MKNFGEFLKEAVESNWEGGKRLQTYEEVAQAIPSITITNKFDFQSIDKEYFFEFESDDESEFRVYFDRETSDIVLLDQSSGEEIVLESPEKFRNYLISTTKNLNYAIICSKCKGLHRNRFWEN